MSIVSINIDMCVDQTMCPQYYDGGKFGLCVHFTIIHPGKALPSALGAAWMRRHYSSVDIYLEKGFNAILLRAELYKRSMGVIVAGVIAILLGER